MRRESLLARRRNLRVLPPIDKGQGAWEQPSGYQLATVTAPLPSLSSCQALGLASTSSARGDAEFAEKSAVLRVLRGSA